MQSNIASSHGYFIECLDFQWDRGSCEQPEGPGGCVAPVAPVAVWQSSVYTPLPALSALQGLPHGGTCTCPSLLALQLQQILASHLVLKFTSMNPWSICILYLFHWEYTSSDKIIEAHNIHNCKLLVNQRSLGFSNYACILDKSAQDSNAVNK